VRGRLTTWIALASAIAAAACGARSEPPHGSEPVDLAYALDGEPHRLSELRGRPLVLVLIRTSEVVSQMYLDEVAEAHARTAGRLRFLVLTIEPSEAPFVDLFRESEGLPFPVGVAEADVAQGRSGLGLIPLVPSTYLVAPDGRVEDVAAGAVPAEDIVREVERRRWP